MPCLNPFCQCHHKQPTTKNPDERAAGWRAFIRRRSRVMQDLWCSVCKLHPPKHVGGPCEDCERELGASG